LYEHELLWIDVQTTKTVQFIKTYCMQELYSSFFLVN